MRILGFIRRTVPEVNIVVQVLIPGWGETSQEHLDIFKQAVLVLVDRYRRGGVLGSHGYKTVIDTGLCNRFAKIKRNIVQ